MRYCTQPSASGPSGDGRRVKTSNIPYTRPLQEQEMSSNRPSSARFPLAVQTNSKGNPFFLATLVRNRPAGSPVTHPSFPPGPAAGLQGTRPLLSSAFSVFLRACSHRSTYSSFLRPSTECTRVFSCPSSSFMHSRKVCDVHCTLQQYCLPVSFRSHTINLSLRGRGNSPSSRGS